MDLPASAGTPLVPTSKARLDRTRPCLGYRQNLRTVLVEPPRNEVRGLENMDAICNALNHRRFLKGDLALFAVKNREQMHERFGGVRIDGFNFFGSFSVHPYHTLIPQDGDAFFLRAIPDPKILSPSSTSTASCFSWKASGSPQALHLSFPSVSTKTESAEKIRPPLCVYKNYHYIVNVDPHSPSTPGKRADRAKVLTMRVYTIHDGRCDCNACRRSREQTLAKRSANALFAQDYALVLVLDKIASGVWKKRRTSEEAESDASAASTPSSSAACTDLASTARDSRIVNAGGLKGSYVRPLIFCRAEDDLLPTREDASVVSSDVIPIGNL